MATANTLEVYQISPDLDRENETVVPYYKHAPEVFERVMGESPNRNSLYKYLYEMPGYPIKRYGPYVKVPFFLKRKRVYTTVEAFERFIRMVAQVERKHGIEDVDMAALK